MKDEAKDSTADIAKYKSEKNPDSPKVTPDQPDSSEVAQLVQKPLPRKDAFNKPQVESQEPQLLEAAKGNDEVMSQPPQPAAPPAQPTPKIDADLKLARRETAQEEVHEVMSKREASKLVVKEKPKASPKRSSIKSKPG